jgi:Ca-activated chloride channel family protein
VVGSANQYEPYYLSSNYAVNRKSSETDKAGQRYDQIGGGVSSMPVAQKVKEEKGFFQIARLKSATDDIGDQFSPGNTNFTKSKDMNSPAVSNILAKNDTGKLNGFAQGGQYEPYYMKSNYALEQDNKKIALRDGEVSSAMTVVNGGAKIREIYPPMDASARNYNFRNEEELRYQPAYQQPIYPASPAESESYQPITENGFLNPLNEALSTFSIDVDTASYANIRRYLNQGQLPPVDSVRIEEMINYFTYDYPEPSWGQPFSLTTEIAPCPWNPSHQLALVGVQGKRLSSLSMPASNLVFLIDVSGSMNAPDKLPLLQDAFKMMTRELESKDKISIVVYAGAAGLVLEATPGNYKEEIINAINRLQAGGSTAGGAGIQLAYQTARANFITKGNNRVILATDGDFNVGVSDGDDLVQMIKNYRDQGIFLTILGFGTGNYKDSKMEKLADEGNGNYFYIDNINEAHKVLVRELGSTLYTIAKDVKIQVEFNPATVQSYRLIGYENRALAKEDFNNDKKDAGELGAGHSVTALYEIIPNNGVQYANQNVDPLIYQKTQSFGLSRYFNSDVMTVKLRYKEPKGSSSKLIQKSVRQNEMNRSQISDNFRLASSIAEFGLLLRQSSYRGQASFDHILREAGLISQDPNGYRQEFIGLVQQAKYLSPNIPYIIDDDPQPYPMDYGSPSHKKGQK